MKLIAQATQIKAKLLIENPLNVTIRQGQNRQAQTFSLIRSICGMSTLRKAQDSEKMVPFSGPLDGDEVKKVIAYDPSKAQWRKDSILLLEPIETEQGTRYSVIGGHGRHLALNALIGMNAAWGDFEIPARLAKFDDDTDRLAAIIADNDDSAADAGTLQKMEPSARFVAALKVLRVGYVPNAAYKFDATGNELYSTSLDPSSSSYERRFKCGGSERVTMAALSRIALHLDVPPQSFNSGNIKCTSGTAAVLVKATDANDPKVKMFQELGKGLETRYIEDCQHIATLDSEIRDAEYARAKKELNDEFCLLMGLNSETHAVDTNIKPWASVNMHDKSKDERASETEERKRKEAEAFNTRVADRARESVIGSVAADALNNKMHPLVGALLRLFYAQLSMVPAADLESIRGALDIAALKKEGGVETALTVGAKFIVPNVYAKLAEQSAELQLLAAQLEEQKQHREEQFKQAQGHTSDDLALPDAQKLLGDGEKVGAAAQIDVPPKKNKNSKKA